MNQPPGSCLTCIWTKGFACLRALIRIRCLNATEDLWLYRLECDSASENKHGEPVEPCVWRIRPHPSTGSGCCEVSITCHHIKIGRAIHSNLLRLMCGFDVTYGACVQCGLALPFGLCNHTGIVSPRSACRRRPDCKAATLHRNGYIETKFPH